MSKQFRRTMLHVMKMVRQVKNPKNKEENSNRFNPLGENKEVTSNSISSPSTQEVVRNEPTKVTPLGRTQKKEMKDQNDPSNKIVEVVSTLR